MTEHDEIGDLFAGLTMQALVTKYGLYDNTELISTYAYEMAEAMLKERKNRRERKSDERNKED